MVDEEEKKEVLEKKQDNKPFFIKGIIIIFAVISWIVTIFIIFQSESNPLYFIIVSSIITIGALVLLFWNSISSFFNKQDDEEKIPKPATKEELFKIVKETVEGEAVQDHIDEYKGMKDYNINENVIWHFEIKPYLGKENVHLIINSNYPEEPASILYKPSSYELLKIINSKSKKPLDEPETRKTVVENLLTGNITTQEEKKPSKSKEKKKKEDSVV